MAGPENYWKCVMSFKQGRYYAIQGRNSTGTWVFLEANSPTNINTLKLRAIAKRAGKSAGRPVLSRNTWDDEEDDFYAMDPSSQIKVSENPFALKVFEMDCDIQIITQFMRYIRKDCGSAGIDPNTIRLVIVTSGVQVMIPEPQSQAEIELRKFALEKLSDEEKELLKVKHWEVYHKLGDRSMLDDDEEDDG